MAVLSNARNVNITGGHFTAINGQTGSKGMDRLREHSALAALLNSNERFDPPRCDEDTRVGIIQDIMAWVNSDDHSASMTVLHGSAGAGKSALEQTIAERCLREGILAASFFFSRTALNRSNGNTLIPTIAYQLAQIYPPFRQRVLEQVDRDPGVFELSREAQMEKLVVKCLESRPLSRLRRYLRRLSFRTPDPRFLQRAVVIDGLDECNDHDVQCDLLRILASATLKLQLPIRILLACRPESHLMHALNHHPALKAIPVRRIDLGDDPDADTDICTFLGKEFQKIKDSHPLRAHLPPSWPGEVIISNLIAKASGQFIYVSTVINYVRSLKHNPEVRLQVVLGLQPSRISTDRPFSQLDTLYSFIFSCVKDIDTVFRILGILFLTATSGTVFGLHPDMTTPAFLEQIIGVKPGEIGLALDELLSLLTIADRDQPIKILHASLFDFLLDEDRSGTFALDVALAHETLAIWRWKCIDKENKDWVITQEHAFTCFLRHSRHSPLSDGFITTYLDSVCLLDSRWISFVHGVKCCKYDSAIIELYRTIFDRQEVLNHEFSLKFVQRICMEVRRSLFGSSSIFCKGLTIRLRDYFQPLLERAQLMGDDVNKDMIDDTITAAKYLVFLKSVAYIPIQCGTEAHGSLLAFIFHSQWDGYAFPPDVLRFAITVLPSVIYDHQLNNFLIRSPYSRRKTKGVQPSEIEQKFDQEVIGFLKRNESEFDQATWSILKDRWGFE